MLDSLSPALARHAKADLSATFRFRIGNAAIVETARTPQGVGAATNDSASAALWASGRHRDPVRIEDLTDAKLGPSRFDGQVRRIQQQKLILTVTPGCNNRLRQQKGDERDCDNDDSVIRALRQTTNHEIYRDRPEPSTRSSALPTPHAPLMTKPVNMRLACQPPAIGSPLIGATTNHATSVGRIAPKRNA